MRASLQETKRHPEPGVQQLPPATSPARSATHPSASAELQVSNEATSTSLKRSYFEPAVQQVSLPRCRRRLLQRMVIVRHIHK